MAKKWKASMTLVERSIDEIKKLILDGNFDENKFLPSEGELSKRMGVSRATTREAVRSLEVRGFVKRIHGKGIQVVDDSAMVLSQSITDMFDMNEMSLDDLLEVRLTIETKAARLAAVRSDQKDFEKMRACIEIMASCKTAREKEYIRADLKFHRYLVAATKNSVFMAITHAYTGLLKKLIVETTDTEDNIENIHHYHEEILKALENRDEDGAEAAMLGHLSATFENKRVGTKKESK